MVEIPRMSDYLFRSDDSGLVTFASDLLTSWDLGTKQAVGRCPTGKYLATRLFGISCDGRFVATGRKRPIFDSSLPLVQVWDVHTRQQVIEPDFPAMSCAFSR